MDKHIIPLSKCISSAKMQTLALGHLKIKYDTVEILKEQNAKSDAFNLEILVTWQKGNASDDEVAVGYVHLLKFLSN